MCIKNQLTFIISLWKPSTYSVGLGKFYDISNGKMEQQKFGNNLAFMGASEDY